MAAPERAVEDPFGPGPWSEEDVLELRTAQRVELLDGVLLLSPHSAHRHQWLAIQLCGVLNAVLPRGRAIGPINVRLRRNRLVIPDVAVVEGVTRSTVVSDAAAVLLAVEIVSPGNAVMDRAIKPQLYAEAGIPTFLRIEMGADAPVGHLHTLAGGAYHEVAVGTTLHLTRPCAVTVDMAALDLDG
ncbi:Uma2 family endonuclease [Actinomycetospora cinnamomea]|uniref:Uma2 family endonuclease n=1 Tax=Actinomycetospora cinnamomea TaxID=663609 RepID=A0A2U1FA28_9PSEU|nr:Uma2 family endonuclease [Actinomycetospora cinnamomea]PVZ08999.1 Uma2 family endonuclease [Actinomycetospora cinnamomea]